MEKAVPASRIEDLRQGSRSVPAVELLERILPLIPADDLRGIRKIVLLDRNYRAKKALARYVAVKGTKGADIELFLDHYSSLPESLRTSRIYMTFHLAWSLMHEIYHHRVRGLKRLRKPTDRLEDERANRWGHAQAHRILEALFPREHHEEDYVRIRAVQQEMKRAAERVAPTPPLDPLSDAT